MLPALLNAQAALLLQLICGAGLEPLQLAEPAFDATEEAHVDIGGGWMSLVHLKLHWEA